MKTLFDKVEMNHLHLKNRLVRSATWEGVAKPDGGITEEAYKISLGEWEADCNT